MKQLSHILSTFLIIMLTTLSLNIMAQAPFVKVLQPSNSGIQWGFKTRHLISWDDNFTKTVKIELLRYNSGGTFITSYTIAENISGSTYSWYIYKDRNNNTIPVGNQYYYKIRVSSTADHSVKDESNHTFQILDAPGSKVTVLQPSNSGIQWGFKTRHLISWNDNIPGTVKIELLRYNSGGTFITSYTIAENISGSTYSWYIYKDRNNNTIPVGNQYYYKTRVSSTADHSVKDESNHAFQITALPKGTKVTVLQPSNSGIQWGFKTKHLISWNDNIPGTVKIELLRYNSGGTFITSYTIAENISGSTYSWYIYKDRNNNTIPAGNQYYYKIRVSSTVDANVKDESNHYFHIVLQPTIDVYPNPVASQLTLKFNETDHQVYTLTLYNRYNKQVMTRPVNTAYTKEVRINTEYLPDGIYFLRLESGKQVISRKIIVRH